jgi:hypothetical protein
MANVIVNRTTVGYDAESLTVDTNLNVLTASKYKDSVSSGGATDAFITLETANMRYRYDGGSPTSSVGHILYDGGVLILKGQNQMSNFKFIQTGANSGSIYVTYERP